MNEETKEASLQKQLAEERDRRVKACTTELEEVLLKHNCEFRPFAIITSDGRVRANLAIVAKEG